MNNPFKPPCAATLEREAIPVVAPSTIILATRILWMTLAIGLASLIPGYRENYWDESVSLEWIIGIGIFFTVIFAVLVIGIRKGRNWARWWMLALLVLGWWSMVTDPSSFLGQGWLAVVTDLIVTVAEILAVKLLFFGEGAQWFKTLQA